MNLLLIDPAELRSDGTCALSDRRAQHLRSVLGVEVGSTVRAGIVGGSLGSCEVLGVDGDILLRFTATGVISAPAAIDLVLAIPRPKVITRTIEIAASFAVRTIELTNAWRVDKSYLGSPRLADASLGHALRFGAEQGATTHVPPLAIHDRFMGLLDTRWPADGGGTPTTRLLAHPGAPPIEQATLSWPLAIAIGPEGGWIQREIDTFVERGFTPVSIGGPILRVEAALSATLGQLLVLQRLRG